MAVRLVVGVPVAGLQEQIRQPRQQQLLQIWAVAAGAAAILPVLRQVEMAVRAL